MIDVSSKFNTLRYAKAEGTLNAAKETIQRIVEKQVPKGDVLQVARAAGINAAKNTPQWITFCHSMRRLRESNAPCRPVICGYCYRLQIIGANCRAVLRI